MKNYILAAFVSILCLVVINNNAFPQNNSNGISLTKSSDGYYIDLNLPGYSTASLSQNGEPFIKINLDNYGITPEAGLPMLPQISFNLFINTNEKTPAYEVESRNSETKFLNAKVYPTQAPWEKNKNPGDRPFTIDRNYYLTKGSIDNPLVKISEPFVIAGVKGVTVTIFPFAYDPTTNKLIVTKNAKFKIDLKYPAVINSVPESFDKMFRNFFLNYNAVNVTPTNNYLIITAPEYESGMAAFVTHKQNMGYSVFMANTTITGTTNSAILNYIQQRYNNTTTRPEFILLVGDVDKIPNWIGIGPDNPNTDLNYTLLDGNDAYADAFIGRFSVSSSAELTNIITKSIFMEDNINNLPKKNIYMASEDNYTISEGTHNFVIDSFFMPGNYNNVKLYCHTYNATTQQLTDAFNANQSFAIYSGHGGETEWADGPVFTQSNVNALTNTVYPFVYVFSCLTGSYQVPECMAETFIRRTHGASVYWGSSVTSYWDQDDILEKRLIRSMFVDDLKKTTPMMVMAKYYLSLYYGGITSDVRRYFEMYNCFGDPSIYEAAFGPMISHTPLPNTENLNGPYVVNCSITPAGSTIDPLKTKIFWTRGTSFTDSVSLTNCGGNNWTANIPGNGAEASYRYYIKTGDALNRIAVLPGGAPANYFSFNAQPDLTPPVITHTQVGNIGQPMWPATVNCTATDNIGIDSVWVEWYKNTPASSKEFKLINISGSSFSAVFNSPNSEVTAGDSIFYVIKAKDNSAAHNLCQSPASGHYAFMITSLTSSSFCKDTYLPIRDNQTTADTFFISSHGTITDFNFKMERLIHTYDGDVSFTITSPSGQAVILSANHGGGGQNYINTVFDDSATTHISEGTAPFTGTFKPDIPMTVFNGQEMYGAWILRVNDDADIDTGHVERYCLIMQYTSIIGISDLSIPRKFEIKQNYPNPFNPVTIIKYSIPKSSLVKMTVYDILGREVSKLVNSVEPAGNYEVNFDGSNLASGIYFYRIEARQVGSSTGSFVEVKKMVLLK